MSIIEEIRQGLDPAYSYVIFEKRDGSGQGIGFREVIAILENLELKTYELKVLQDPKTGHQLLVAKLDPCPTNKIMQELLTAGLPEGISLFAYGSKSAG